MHTNNIGQGVILDEQLPYRQKITLTSENGGFQESFLRL